jgi:uncharacterized membrane protein YkoI
VRAFGPICAGWIAMIAMAAGARAADVTCYSDWSVAAPIVQQEGLVTVEQLTAAARVKLKGDIVKTTLCKEKDGYVFRLVVRGADGRLNPVTVDAKKPFGD